jgi:hypothetical protein
MVRLRIFGIATPFLMVAFTLLAQLPTQAATDRKVDSTFKSEVIDPTTITGDIRFYDFRGWHDQNHPYPTQPYRSYDAQGTAAGGDFKLKTGQLAGFNLGFALFTQHSIIDYASPNADLFKTPDVTQIAEAFLRYEISWARVTLGRQLMNTPFANSDMYTMLTRSFQGASAAFILLGKGEPDGKSEMLTKDVLAPFKYDSQLSPADLKLYLARMTRYESRFASAFTSDNRYSPALHVLNPLVPEATPGLATAGLEYTQGLNVGDILARGWGYNFFDYASLQFLESGFQAAAVRGVRPYLRAAYVHETDSGAAYLGRVRADYFAAKLGVNFSGGSFELIAANAPRHVGTFRNGGLVHPYNDLSDVLYDDTMISGLEDLGPGHAFGADVTYLAGKTFSFKLRYIRYVAYYGTNGSVYAYDGPVFFAGNGLINGALIPDQRSYALEGQVSWQLGTLALALKGLSIGDDLALRGGFTGENKYVNNRLRLVYDF